SIKAVNSLSHYTDWTVGHVHSGALGWNGLISFAALYFMVPRLWGRARLYSERMVAWHFWLAMIGIVVYAAVLWVSGLMRGLMWRQCDQQSSLLYFFAATVQAMFPYYLARALGGALYLAGAIIMAFNLTITILGNQREEEPIGGKS